MATPCLADHNIPRPPRTRGGAALAAGPLDARGDAALAAGPLDATVVGAALEKARPPLRAPHGPDVTGSGNAARADDAAMDREDGAPHGESNETGRGQRADIVAARRPWDGGRKEHQPADALPARPPTRAASPQRVRQSLPRQRRTRHARAVQRR